jgi:hypothetical protein
MLARSKRLLFVSVNWENNLCHSTFWRIEYTSYFGPEYHHFIFRFWSTTQESGSYGHVCQLSILNPFNLKFNNSFLVKWSRYRPGVAQSVGRGIALLFHDRGTRGGEWSAARPGRTLSSGKTRYPFYWRLGGPQGRSERAENLISTGIRSRTIQSVVSRYTDWATQPIISPNEIHTNRHVPVLIAPHFTRILKCSFTFEPLARVAHRLKEISFQ